jgi:predicted nucleic acid-binding protein
MNLVDTSSWIQQIRRRGDPIVRARVEQLLRSGEAVWCPPVRLELWSGVGSNADRELLRAYEERIPELSVTDEACERACRLAERCRRAGRTVPPSDILIAACALHHGVEVERDDSRFDLLAAVFEG